MLANCRPFGAVASNSPSALTIFVISSAQNPTAKAAGKRIGRIKAAEAAGKRKGRIKAAEATVARKDSLNPAALAAGTTGGSESLPLRRSAGREAAFFAAEVRGRG